MEELFNYNEYLYLNEINETCRASFFIGIKGSGKTYMALNVFKFLYMNKKANGYKSFHLVLPNYSNEENDSYQFIKELKKEKDVYIYDRFNEDVLEHVMNTRKKHGEKALWIIDDATGHFSKTFYDGSQMVNILTDARHLKINIIICAHHVTGVFKPVYRSMFDFIFIFNVSNGTLLNGMHKEFISLHTQYGSWKEFKKEFNDKVIKQEYAFLYIDNVNRVINFSAKDDWLISKLHIVSDLMNYV